MIAKQAAMSFVAQVTPPAVWTKLYLLYNRFLWHCKWRGTWIAIKDRFLTIYCYNKNIIIKIITIIIIIIIIITATICMGLLLPNFPDFWHHLYYLVLLLRWNWYFCYGYGTFATQRYYCCKIRKRHHNNIIGSNMDDRAGETWGSKKVTSNWWKPSLDFIVVWLIHKVLSL